MTRVSKYATLVGTVVDGVLVSDYRRLNKISKTGRKYYRYEVQVENVLWISTQSFNKRTFKKRLDKIKQTAKQLLPANQDDIMIVDFFGIMEQHFIDRMAEEYGKAENMKEIKTVYRKWAKKTHPDKGVYAHKEAFELVKGSYEIFAEIRRIAVDTCREAGVEMEY